MSSPNDHIPWDRLAAYAAGALTPEEEAQLLAWAASDPEREELLDSVRKMWAAAELHRPPLDPDLALRAIKRRDIGAAKVVRLPMRLGALTPKHRPLRRALAAAAVAVMAVGGWWALRGVASRPGQASERLALREFKTARGQRLALSLPDGSSVMLGPESVLRYSAAYGTASRTVMLEGDGYFEVNHDPAHPFEVQAAQAVARDLGTRFVVRARGDAVPVDVAVADGRVALSSSSRTDSVVLNRGDLGQVGRAGRASVHHQAKLDSYFGWTEGRLVFDGTPLPVVAAELSRWYDVDVQLAGSGLAERRLTASFHNEPITKVLPMLEASLGVQVTQVGRQLIVTAR
jgi:transmembrane sensor